MSDDEPTLLDETTLPETADGTPVLHSHVPESRSGAALSVGDVFILLFHDRAIYANVTGVKTEGDTDG